MRSGRSPLWYALAVLAGFGLRGTPAEAQQGAQPAPCSGSPYRQFDFWIGEWEVTNPQGTVVGHNTIEAILNGCVLSEHWRSAQGGSGRSHNIYDLQSEQWHQTWVDASGTLLLLDGGLDDRGRMVMRGETIGQGGGTVLNEISWELKPDASVNQVWRVSSDGGTTWQTVFDGTYRKTTGGSGGSR